MILLFAFRCQVHSKTQDRYQTLNESSDTIPHTVICSICNFPESGRPNTKIILHFRLASKDVPITILMGNQNSGSAQDGLPPRSAGGKVEAIGSLRRTGPVGPGAPRRPMPDEAELERRFNEVLLQMDLPPDRAKLLKSFDNAKKWDIICDREQVRSSALV